jgi:AcrR family transcriptional regulator
MKIHNPPIQAELAGMTRRERIRGEIRDEIKAIARQQMAEQGTASLSLTAIARRMELTPPALYRYYPDRDALVTALIVDAFDALAVALADAAASQPIDQYAARLESVLLAYRSWALANPFDFQLIYGNPIPGYHAPVELTVPAVQRGASVIMGVLQAAYTAGAMHLPEELPAIAESVELRASPESGMHNQAISPLITYVCMTGWAHIHGIIMLELFNHLQPTIGNIDAFYRHEICSLIQHMGLSR